MTHELDGWSQDCFWARHPGQLMETIGVKERELGKQYGQELEAEERLANQGERATSRGRRGSWGGGQSISEGASIPWRAKSGQEKPQIWENEDGTREPGTTNWLTIWKDEVEGVREGGKKSEWCNQ